MIIEYLSQRNRRPRRYAFLAEEYCPTCGTGKLDEEAECILCVQFTMDFKWFFFSYFYRLSHEQEINP